MATFGFNPTALYGTAEATLDVLRLVFEDRIISRRADVIWPPWSCDLTPLGYYRLTEDADFRKKIIFSDEVHFELGGYVNEQNCRI